MKGNGVRFPDVAVPVIITESMLPQLDEYVPFTFVLTASLQMISIATFASDEKLEQIHMRVTMHFS